MEVYHKINDIEDYEPFVGAETLDRIMRKAKKLRDIHVAHVNSTYYGGGVAELLSSLVLLFNSIGIKSGWRVIQGSPDFFSITKKMHNALQGEEINLTRLKKKIYEDIIFENAVRNHLEHDAVIIHDPQPLPMIRHYRKRGPWIWRCHIDMTEPNGELWDYLLQFVEMYDAAIFTLKEYGQDMRTPQLYFMPAINPFEIKNRDMSEAEIDERLDHYKIPRDLPLVVQISRFDRWKDPSGVIEAFRLARKKVDCTLVLLGNVATDDPEGPELYESLLGSQEERIIILSVQDTALVNALQRKAAVVIQKSIREGFGLTVTEAMWKGAVVIGSNVGGIKYQIENGENGFLVSSVEECGERIVDVLKDGGLRKKMSEKATETVKERFLLTRLAEQYLDLLNSIETCFTLKKNAT